MNFFGVGEEVYLGSGSHCRAGVAWDRLRWNSYRDPLLLDGTSLVSPWGSGESRGTDCSIRLLSVARASSTLSSDLTTFTTAVAEVVKTGRFTTSASEAAEVAKTSLFTTSASKAAEVVKAGRFTTSASEAAEVVKTNRSRTSAGEYYSARIASSQNYARSCIVQFND